MFKGSFRGAEPGAARVPLSRPECESAIEVPAAGTNKPETTDFYDSTYRSENYFRYSNWLYEPYVSSLIAFCGLKTGDSVLDVGCGQGFFSYMFGKHGMRVHGIDTSEAGIRTAGRLYGHLGIEFSVLDAQTANFPRPFDCVFIRSCSLYNSHTFPLERSVTDSLLRHVKRGGVFLFVYNSNFSSKISSKWRYHSMEDMRRHFGCYPSHQMYFLNKFTTFLLRANSFAPIATRSNILLSKVSGMGGDLLCILRC